MIELFSPTIDIILFSVIFYSILYMAYAFFLGKNIAQVTRMDLRFSFVAILLIVANYWGSAARIDVFGLSVNWFVYYLATSFFIELAILIIYKKYFGIKWDSMIKK